MERAHWNDLLRKNFPPAVNKFEVIIITHAVISPRSSVDSERSSPINLVIRTIPDITTLDFHGPLHKLDGAVRVLIARPPPLLAPRKDGKQGGVFLGPRRKKKAKN